MFSKNCNKLYIRKEFINLKEDLTLDLDNKDLELEFNLFKFMHVKINNERMLIDTTRLSLFNAYFISSEFDIKYSLNEEIELILDNRNKIILGLLFNILNNTTINEDVNIEIQSERNLFLIFVFFNVLLNKKMEYGGKYTVNRKESSEFNGDINNKTIDLAIGDIFIQKPNELSFFNLFFNDLYKLINELEEEIYLFNKTKSIIRKGIIIMNMFMYAFNNSKLLNYNKILFIINKLNDSNTLTNLIKYNSNNDILIKKIIKEESKEDIKMFIDYELKNISSVVPVNLILDIDYEDIETEFRYSSYEFVKLFISILDMLPINIFSDLFNNDTSFKSISKYLKYNFIFIDSLINIENEKGVINYRISKNLFDINKILGLLKDNTKDIKLREFINKLYLENMDMKTIDFRSLYMVINLVLLEKLNFSNVDNNRIRIELIRVLYEYIESSNIINNFTINFDEYSLSYGLENEDINISPYNFTISNKIDYVYDEIPNELFNLFLKNVFSIYTFTYIMKKESVLLEDYKTLFNSSDWNYLNSLNIDIEYGNKYKFSESEFKKYNILPNLNLNTSTKTLSNISFYKQFNSSSLDISNYKETSKSLDLDNRFIPSIDLTNMKLFLDSTYNILNGTNCLYYKELNKLLNFDHLKDTSFYNKVIAILNYKIRSKYLDLIFTLQEFGIIDIEYNRINKLGDLLNMNFISSIHNRSNLIFYNEDYSDNYKIDSNLELKINFLISLIKNFKSYKNFNEISSLLKELLPYKEEIKFNLVKISRVSNFDTIKLINLFINTAIFHKENTANRLNTLFSKSELQKSIIIDNSFINYDTSILFNIDKISDMNTKKSKYDYINKYLNNMEKDLISKDNSDYSKLNFKEWYFDILCNNEFNTEINIVTFMVQSLTFSEFMTILSINDKYNRLHNQFEFMINRKSGDEYFKEFNKLRYINKYFKLTYKMINDLYSNNITNIDNYMLILNEFITSIDDKSMTKFIEENYNIGIKNFINLYKDKYKPIKIYKDFLNIEVDQLLEKKFSIKEYTNREFSIKLHKHDDPICIILGDITNCCQTVSGGASSSVKEGLLNPYSGFLTINKNDKIIAQSWVWLDYTKEYLILDSVETKYIDLVEDISKCIIEWAKIQNMNIVIGLRYSKLNIKLFKNNNWIELNNRNSLNNDIDLNKFNQTFKEVKNTYEYYLNLNCKINNSDIEYIEEDIESYLNEYKRLGFNNIRISERQNDLYSDAKSDILLYKMEMVKGGNNKG